MDKLIDTLVRPEIRALSSYHVPDASGYLKLDAMENPNAWPGESLKQAWLDALSSVEANRYPDPAAAAVKDALAERMGLPELQEKSGLELDLMFGNGSDEIIQILAMALASEDRCIMAPERPRSDRKAGVEAEGADVQSTPAGPPELMREKPRRTGVRRPALEGQIRKVLPSSPTARRLRGRR